MEHIEHKQAPSVNRWMVKRRGKMDMIQTNCGDTTSGAGQYLSSLLQLAFVISKLLLKTDLLKGADRKSRDRQKGRHIRGILKHSMQ